MEAEASAQARGTLIERRSRSLLRNYAEQINALGPWLWVRFKVQRIRSRFTRPGTKVWVRTPFAAHRLAVRAHTSDTNVFSQVFIHHEYRCLDDVVDPQLIIDCGANVGYSAAYLLTRFPRAELIAIEPHPGNFVLMTENLRPYGSRCQAIEAGVWSAPGELMVSSPHVGDREEWAVTVRQASGTEMPTVAAVDIGSVLAESQHERISILKVDIEGSEAEVFATNTEPWIDKVDRLVIELHGEQCRQVVMNAVAHIGFEVSECEELTVFRR